jgi:fatty acid amide hydrolase
VLDPKLNSDDLTTLGAAEVARRIADGAMSSVEVIAAMIARCKALQPTLNAITVTRYDQALREAELADELRKTQSLLPPLLGVPITVKDCFDVEGMPSTLGLATRREHQATADAEVIRRLRDAGAIVIAKTNVPQAMLFHECDNPLFGLTPHPEFDDRTCGGSSGGEAALIAAGGSLLGCGTDLGGSIRVPAHFCGIQGLKPTSPRVSTAGIVRNLVGMNDIPLVAGPMARRVEDLALAYHVMADCRCGKTGQVGSSYYAAIVETKFAGMRIGYWEDDQYFTPSPAIRRAVRESAEKLAGRGADLVPFTPPAMNDLVRLYCAVLGADGGAALRRLLAGNVVDPRLKHLLTVARIPGWLRQPLAKLLVRYGRNYEADLLTAARCLSADGYWRVCHEADTYRRQFEAAWQAAQLDAAICPPFALPAMRHGDSIKLLACASSTFLPNLLDVPAGVVTTTRVAHDEESDRTDLSDPVVRLARKHELGSAGLPVGVQVIAPAWGEQRVLAIMAALENKQETSPVRTTPERQQDEYSIGRTEENKT